MATFTPQTTGVEVVEAYPEKVKGKTCKFCPSIAFFPILWLMNHKLKHML